MNEKIADLIVAAESNDADAQYELYGYIGEDDVSEGNKMQIVDWLQRSAKLGNAMSMKWLGICYSEGIVIAADEKKAFAWFVESARAGNGLASLKVGEYYKKGKIVAKDYAKAIDYFKKAIESDGALDDAEVALGRSLRYRAVHGDDLAWWEAVAVRSVKYPVVPFAVGNYYYMLKEPDMEKSIRFYKIGAKQGYGHSQYVLGKFYYTGEVVDKDHKMALYWLEQASQQDVAPAMYYLGKLYADDQSAVFDMEKAASWWMRSLVLDNRQESQGLAELELSWCFSLGVGVDQFEQDVPDEYIDKTMDYLLRANDYLPTKTSTAVDEDSWWYRYVKRGDAHALYWLGMCYRHISALVPPKGGDRNVCMFDCYRKAAEMGHFGAQYAVAEYFYNGPISVRDREEGLRWYRLAAAQGYPDAIEDLQEIEATSKKT
jgi:TPR repeat protein